MKPQSGTLTEDVYNTIAYYKSKAVPCDRDDLPEGTYVYRKGGYAFYIPDPDFSQPPVDVERKHHFNNIAARYQMPEDIPARDVQAYAMFLFHARRENIPEIGDAAEIHSHPPG